MRPQYGNVPASPSFWLQLISRNISILLFLSLSTGGMMSVYWYFTPGIGSAEAITAISESGGLSAPITKNVSNRVVSQRLTQSPGPVKIGIIVGHAGNDSGAVCEDGLTEVEINRNLATKLMAHLQVAGINVELLDEFDPRLRGYNATAVISIHSDSCNYYNELATGFKISGSPFTDSSYLSICMQQAYATATQLSYHANSITPHMTDYHAFRQIGLGTQAIIIEVGFMNLDREILTIRSDTPAQGLANGVLCFLGENR